jgi:hypothetical protein
VQARSLQPRPDASRGFEVSSETSTQWEVLKQCGEPWQAAKAAGTTNGATWTQFLSHCRAQLSSGAATATPTPAPTTQPQTGSLFP